MFYKACTLCVFIHIIHTCIFIIFLLNSKRIVIPSKLVYNLQFEYNFNNWLINNKLIDIPVLRIEATKW